MNRDAQKKELGHTGEAVAAKYYRQRGYLLLNHNYRTRMGELDLILYKDGGLVFAEVKTRTSAAKARPADSVDSRKQRRLIAAAQFYLQRSDAGGRRLADPLYPERLPTVSLGCAGAIKSAGKSAERSGRRA